MNLKSNWWKLLGVILTIYVLIAGFKIPLQPGILELSQSNAVIGEEYSTEITTYNTFLKSAEDLNVWIWLPNDKLIKAYSTNVINETKVEANFKLPSDIKKQSKKALSAKILIDSKTEGHYFMRQAVFIKEGKSQSIPYKDYYEIDVIKTKTRLAFPFQHILYETNRNTFFHVAIWMSMFALLLVSCYYSLRYLINPLHDYDKRSSSLTTVAIVFGVAGLLTGSMWAKYTWGAFWTSDVKLNMTAISLLIYLGYWILRGSVSDIDSRARLSSVFNLFAFVCLMILVMVIPRLTDSLHPGNGGNPAFSTYDLDNTMRIVFYPAIIAYFLIGLWIAQLNYRYLKVKDYLDFEQ